MVSKFSNLINGCSPKHLAYFAALVVLKVKPYEFVRTIVIVVNLVFSGVLRGAGGRHV